MTNSNSQDLTLTNSADEVRRLVSAGFCPVECSIGGGSVVDDLSMDHHGSYSHLEGVAVRAYRDHFGARAKDPRFVVVGTADADATFAIAALAGILPHPSRAKEFESAPPPVKAAMTRDLQALAETVNLVDVNPIGVDVSSLPFGDVLLTWNALTLVGNDTLGLQAGVGAWRNLTCGNQRSIAPFLAVAKASEASRQGEAASDLENRGKEVGDGGVILIEESRSWGFDVWYTRLLEAGGSEDISGWKHPVVLALAESGKSVTIGCPNAAVAEKLFGDGGLKNVFPELDKLIPGWGGREAVGGSPRGVELNRTQAHAAAKVVASLVNKS